MLCGESVVVKLRFWKFTKEEIHQFHEMKEKHNAGSTDEFGYEMIGLVASSDT